MIKGITGGRHVMAAGSTSYPYVPMNANNPIQGMLRLNGQDIQTFDGNSWITVHGTYASVNLQGSAESAIDWAIDQMTKEAEYKELAKKSKAVKLALEKVELAKAELKILAELAKTDYEETTS